MLSGCEVDRDSNDEAATVKYVIIKAYNCCTASFNRQEVFTKSEFVIFDDSR